MTYTRSHSDATMPRSCEMSSRAMSRSVVNRRRTFRIWAWMVTSRAVVGSSAMIRSGLQASAIAMRTRCRIPPDSWNG
ncbi:hypothetical protein BJF78_19420 [Pseudonocardia sp. CNS-139]|nr:hypothetical protein BJF78_19420 [Pseudonocardia sp. CNS-139]